MSARRWSSMRSAGPDVAAADVVPLSRRAAAMLVVRMVVALELVLVAVGSGSGRWVVLVCAATVHLMLAMVLTLPTLLLARVWAVRGFAASLLVDGIFLQIAHEALGHAVATDVAIATSLVAACLLGSFRSGVKAAAWQSVVMLVALRCQQSGLLPPWPDDGAVDGTARELALASDIAFLWVAVLTCSVTSAINERELKRRRYDAEALRRLATEIHGDERPQQVTDRLCRFLVEELGARSAVVCRRTDDGWSAVGGYGHREQGDHHAEPGPDAELLTFPTGEHDEILSLTLDPVRDRWLTEQLPAARRVIALAVPMVHVTEWVVVDHGAHRGTRIERRIMTSAAQAVATAVLGRSRAELLARAERAAALDGLTGLANRRAFDAALADLVLSGRPFCVVLMDVDHFKSVNDRYGHQAGDAVLQHVARTMTDHAPGSATAARYGGEEFALLLPGTSGGDAVAVADRIRRALPTTDACVPVTASFGVASAPEAGTDVDALIRAADSALYRAKRDGRDRVVRAGTVPLPRADIRPAPGSPHEAEAAGPLVSSLDLEST